MMTSQVETFADIGGISGPDINLKAILRREVCPEFFTDVGRVSWRRVVGTINVVANTPGYDLADDFGEMVVLSLGDDLTKPDVQYIGEDPDALLAAQYNIGGSGVPARPTGYFLGRRSGTLYFKHLSFNFKPDQNYPNCTYIYYSFIPFADDTTDVDLSKYVPDQFQWGLVKLLTKKICFYRFGIGDPRYVAADEDYGRWIQRATDNPELARRNHAVFGR